jgi:hypothetical protein
MNGLKLRHKTSVEKDLNYFPKFYFRAFVDRATAVGIEGGLTSEADEVNAVRDKTLRTTSAAALDDVIWQSVARLRCHCGAGRPGDIERSTPRGPP